MLLLFPTQWHTNRETDPGYWWLCFGICEVNTRYSILVKYMFYAGVNNSWLRHLEIAKINMESVCNFAKTLPGIIAFSGPLLIWPVITSLATCNFSVAGCNNGVQKTTEPLKIIWWIFGESLALLAETKIIPLLWYSPIPNYIAKFFRPFLEQLLTSQGQCQGAESLF